MDDLDLAMMEGWESDGHLDRIQTYAAAGEFIEKRIARRKGKNCDDDLELSDILVGLIDHSITQLNPIVIVVDGEAEQAGVSA